MDTSSNDIFLKNNLTCYHCGLQLNDKEIFENNDKKFCCEGCKTVYLLLNENELGNYYCLNDSPGTRLTNDYTDYSLLDLPEIAANYIHFSNGEQTRAGFFLPGIHCSSCLWLLEHLSKLNSGIIHSEVTFTSKRISIAFRPDKISLKQVAELLAKVGYEPFLSISSETENDKKQSWKNPYLKLGVTGFCFANIMLISFPEYLGLSYETDKAVSVFFRYVNLLLSLPVFFYGASEFFYNAYKSISQRFLNIDAPIALAILVTFIRSVYEIVTQTGPGFLDSMSGIVFFMLIGRTIQNKTMAGLNFNRDYQSYFPIAVTVIDNGIVQKKPLKAIEKDDKLLLHHNEIIPTDGIIISGNTDIDYSFVTGETIANAGHPGDMLYAGGKIAGPSIEFLCLKPFTQNSFTQLWQNAAFTRQESAHDDLVTRMSKYFSIAVLTIATITFLYWYPVSSKAAWNALTAVLIIACPCALLLVASFTHGYALAMFQKFGLFLKNAKVIGEMAAVNHIVFDKTGTITEAKHSNVIFTGVLTKEQKNIVLSLLRQSIHPLAKAITDNEKDTFTPLKIIDYKEIKGKGIEAYYDDILIKIGSGEFVQNIQDVSNNGSEVYVKFDDVIIGKYIIHNYVKTGMKEMLSELKGYKLSLLSGDNNIAQKQMEQLFPLNTTFLFNQTPQNKLDYINDIQIANTQNVMMIGDGLNDAGALKQSNVGISVVNNSFSFAAASKGILNSNSMKAIPSFLKAAKAVRKVMVYIFIYSLIYNLIGLYFSVTAQMQPLIAAIIMPCSSLSIILFSYLLIKWIEKKYMTKIMFPSDGTHLL